MNYLSFITGLCFWTGQVYLAHSIINRYMVYIPSLILRNGAIILFGLFMGLWPPFVFVKMGHNEIIAGVLTLHPLNFEGWLLFLFLLYGFVLFIKNIITDIARKIRGPVPDGVKLKSRKIIDIGITENLSTPSLPLRMEVFLGHLNDYYKLEISEYQVEIAGLAESFDGFRLAHVSDLHYDGKLNDGFYQECIKQLKKLKPDLIAVTGDVISRGADPEMAYDIMSKMQAPEGVAVIRGNHDFKGKGRQVKNILEKAGCMVLDNRETIVRKGKDTLHIAGVEHPWNRDRDWDRKLISGRETTTICLTHTPDNFMRAAQAGAGLVLCGHTHGGQIRVPLFGPVLCPTKFSKKYDQGFFKRNQSILYVSRGIGSIFPLRIGCVPELTLFELKSVDK